MKAAPTRQTLLIIGLTLTVVLPAVHRSWQEHWHAIGSPAAYLVLMILPGLVIHRWLERAPRALDMALSAICLSPVVVAGMSALLLVFHVSPAATAQILVLTWGFLAAVTVAFRNGSRRDPELTGRRVAVLVSAGIILGFAAAYLPLSEEAWRARSDAWFHSAVVSQIDTYGIPPEDPYFVGLQLQYMWYYHVLILLLSKATHIEPMIIMPLINVHGLIGFMLAAYLLSTFFKKRFAYGLCAALTVVLGLNALFWVFLPAKLFRLFIGEVRGWDEVVRNFTLVPFNKDTVDDFLRTYYNQTFMLNKFIVSTAFSLALCLMGGFWYAAVTYLSHGRRVALVFALLSAAGMLLFHPLVGFIVLAGLIGGLILTHFFRRAIDDYAPRRPLRLLLAVLSSMIVAAPYLYSVMHLKESEQIFPLSLSHAKTAALIISCALVLILSIYQMKGLIARRTIPVYFLLMFALTLLVICNLINLPGPNTFDKTPFFIFYPLAIVGSWTIADRLSRRHASRRYKARVLLVALLLLLPVNTLALSAYFNTHVAPRLSAEERQIASWARKETPRDAIFFDSGDRVFLLNAGPRRYFWGRQVFANMWQYNQAEIKRRRHVRDSLYSGAELDSIALAELGAFPEDVFIIVRRDEDQGRAYAGISRHRELFEPRVSAGSISIWEVNREACKALALD
jgi:hypothetical protein